MTEIIEGELPGTRKPRYVAQARDPEVRPHTVMTADLAELRAELAGAPAPPVSAARCGPGPPG